MQEYTYQLARNDDNNIVVYGMINGAIAIVQPFDHRTPGTTPFANDNEAIDWAESWVSEQTKNELLSRAYAAQQESDAALDRAYKQAVILQILGAM